MGDRFKGMTMKKQNTPVLWCLLLVIWLCWRTVARAESHGHPHPAFVPTLHMAHSRIGPGGQNFSRHTFMIIVVTSPAHQPQRREWQRKQWQKSLQLLSANSSFSPTFDFVYRFCIGNQNLSHHLSQLDDEQRLFGDLQFVNSLDYDDESVQQLRPFATSATTTKVLAAVKWAVQTYTFQYLLRLGDDAYFKPEAFVHQFKGGLLPASLACICFVVPTMTYTTTAGEVKAPYPSGMGFVLTYDVAAWLSEAQDMLMVGAPEDGMVGLWFAGTRIRLHHHNGFRDINWRCEGEDLLVHVLRDQEAWDTIDPQGNIPCGGDLRPATLSGIP